MNTVVGGDLLWVVEQQSDDRQERYDECERYYDGDHDLLFETEKFRNAFGNLFQKFADNLCPTVIDAVADRLTVEGWAGSLGKQANQLWEQNHMPRTSSRLFLGALKKGDGFVVMWPDASGFPRMWAQQPEQVCVEYDDEDDPSLIIKAGRVWLRNDGKARVNIYYPDTTVKLITRSPVSNGLPRQLTDYDTFADDVHNPYGMVPVFHLAHDADVGEYGVSRLKDVIPIQRALNKSVCDMLVDGEFLAYPQRYATGLQIEVDEETGKPKNPPFTPGSDRIWAAAGDVKFGQFSAADMKQYIDVQDSFRMEIARVSGLPAHFVNLEGVMPTGEALKVAEGRLIKDVMDCMLAFEPVLQNMTRLGLVMWGKARGRGVDNLEKIDVTVNWANPAPHNPLLDSETELVKKQVGISTRTALRELGYTDDQIDTIFKERDEEARDAAKLAQELGPPPGAPGDPAAPPNAPGGGGKPTAFTRNAPPGQASKPAPAKQQQQKKPIPKPG